MANSSIFSGIGGFGSNVISPLDFMGGFGYSLPWIPTVGAAGAPNEPRRATPIPKVTIDPDQDPQGHENQVRARAEAEGRRDAQSGRPLLEEVPGDEGEAEHWTRVARRDAQIAEYQKIAADPDYEPDIWYIDHWDIHHWSEKIPPGVPIVAQAGTAGQAGVAQAGTQRPPWTGAATWSGELPSEALLRASAETPPDEPAFGQTQTSWDPLGIEGYQATQSSFPSWDDLFSSEYWSDVGRDFPTTGDAAAAAQTALGLGFSAPYMGLGTAAFSALTSAAAKSRMNERIRSQFPELGPAETDFFGRTPGLSDQDMISLAGYSAGAGEGMYTGFPAPGETRGARAPSTELGWAPGDRAYDITTDLTRDAIANPSKWGLPENPYTPGYATPADLWSDKYAIGGKRIADIIYDQGWNMALTEAEWDFQTEPISFEPGTFANPELGEFIGDLSTVSWSDPNVAPSYQSLPGYVSTAGMTYAEGLEKQQAINEALEETQAKQIAHSLPMQELMAVDPAVHHAATAAEAAAKTEAERTAALQLEENKYWNLVKNLGEEQHAPPPPPGIAGTVAGLGYMWGGGQGEDDSYGFGSMDDTDYGMGY